LRIEAHGLRLDLPPGWSGRVFRRPAGNTNLHAGDFPLALDDGEFGAASTARMPEAASFIALVEYLPGRGLEPGRGLFASRRITRRFDPTAFSATALAHAVPGQVGRQEFFTASDRPFCMYLVLSGGRRPRARQLAVFEHVLSNLRIGPRV
jgi:hypothetical protein